MRARDIRAISFLFASTLVLLAAAQLVLHTWLASVALAAAYAAWLASRPRMVRVLRRLKGDAPARPGYKYFDG